MELVEVGGGGIFAVIYLFLSMAILIAFFVTAANVSRIRRLVEREPRNLLWTRTCPFCAEEIKREASVCPFCQRESPAWTLHEGTWWSTDEGGNRYWLDEQQGRWVKWDEPPEPG